MIDMQKLIDCENNYPMDFADVCEKPYGKLFYCMENPQSHDSNHAIVLDLAYDLDRALAKITAFYEARNLVPRIYGSYQDGELELLKPHLENHSFTIKPLVNDGLYLLKRPSCVSPVRDLAIERVTALNREITGLLYTEDEGDWSVKVMERNIHRPNYHLLVGYAGQTLVSMASLNFMDGLSRVDDVVTVKEHRGRGYSSTLIDFLVKYHAQLSSNDLYLWSENPAAIKVYCNAGFSLYPHIPAFWSAWRDTAGQQ